MAVIILITLIKINNTKDYSVLKQKINNRPTELEIIWHTSSMSEEVHHREGKYIFAYEYIHQISHFNFLRRTFICKFAEVRILMS